MKKIMRIAIVSVTLYVAYLVIKNFASEGWKRMALQKSLIAFGCMTVVLIVVIVIMAAVMLTMSDSLRRLRLCGNEEYIKHVAGLEDKYYDLLDENKQLQMDLAQERGQGDMNKIYLNEFTSKPKPSDAQMVDEVNHQFLSTDGQKIEERQRAAFRMSCEGSSKEEIAEELGLGIKSVGVYISKGKKSYLDHGDYTDTKDGMKMTWPNPFTGEPVDSFLQFQSLLNRKAHHSSSDTDTPASTPARKSG